MISDEDVKLETVDHPSHFWKTNMSKDPWIRIEVRGTFIEMKKKDNMWEFFTFAGCLNFVSGLLTQVYANSWVWEVQPLDPDKEQLRNIFNHVDPRPMFGSVQQVSETHGCQTQFLKACFAICPASY